MARLARLGRFLTEKWQGQKNEKRKNGATCIGQRMGKAMYVSVPHSSVYPLLRSFPLRAIIQRHP